MGPPVTIPSMQAVNTHCRDDTRHQPSYRTSTTRLSGPAWVPIPVFEGVTPPEALIIEQV